MHEVRDIGATPNYDCSCWDGGSYASALYLVVISLVCSGVPRHDAAASLGGSERTATAQEVIDVSRSTGAAIDATPS